MLLPLFSNQGVTVRVKGLLINGWRVENLQKLVMNGSCLFRTGGLPINKERDFTSPGTLLRQKMGPREKD